MQSGYSNQQSQGTGGGIRIMEGYRMDRTLLTSKDMQMILAGVRSLDSVSGSHYYSQLMEKIKAGSSDYVSGSESILIDLSSWYKESLSGKIELIQMAIEERKVISFQYYAPGGDSVREIEPYFLIFNMEQLVCLGLVQTKEDFRMFKLNRMDQLIQTSTDVIKRSTDARSFYKENISGKHPCEGCF